MIQLTEKQKDLINNLEYKILHSNRRCKFNKFHWLQADEQNIVRLGPEYGSESYMRGNGYKSDYIPLIEISGTNVGELVREYDYYILEGWHFHELRYSYNEEKGVNVVYLKKTIN